MEKGFWWIEDIRSYGCIKAKDAEKKLEKLENELEMKKTEVEDLEAKIYFKKMRKNVYERISSVETRKQYSKIVVLLDEICDSDNDVDYLDELLAIKYDVEGKECKHAKNDLKCKCK